MRCTISVSIAEEPVATGALPSENEELIFRLKNISIGVAGEGGANRNGSDL